MRRDSRHGRRRVAIRLRRRRERRNGRALAYDRNDDGVFLCDKNHAASFTGTEKSALRVTL